MAMDCDRAGIVVRRIDATAQNTVHAAAGHSARQAARMALPEATMGDSDHGCEVDVNADQLRKLIKVEYWPNTNQWRILIVGWAVGYWDNEEEARSRAKYARAALLDKLQDK